MSWRKTCSEWAASWIGSPALFRGGVVHYQDDIWQPEREALINAFDPKLGIWWPKSGSDLSPDDVIMSDKDRNAPSLEQFDFSCMTI